jgi:hypothetical protein
VDQQLRNSAFGRGMTEEQIAQTVKMSAAQGGLRSIISFLSVAIGLPIGLLLAALFNLLIGKMTGLERSFRHWYSYCCWVSLPLAVKAIPSAVALAMTETTQFTAESLNTLSLNSLIFHRAVGEPGYSFFTNTDLFTFVCLYLSLVAIKVWSGRSWLFAWLFVGIPWVLVYGTWALVSLR